MPNKKDPGLKHRESIFIRRQHESFWFSLDPVKLTAIIKIINNKNNKNNSKTISENCQVL